MGTLGIDMPTNSVYAVWTLGAASFLGETCNCLEGDGFFVSEQGSLDLLTGIHQRVFHWYYQGQRHETKWQIRAYTPPEVAGMLEKAGFQVLAVYGNLVGDMLTRDSTGMTFIAQKQAISS